MREEGAVSNKHRDTLEPGPRADLMIPRVSFEFFPPASADMERTLWASIKSLAPLNPLFVSVTYGAGGSTRERTRQTIARILHETSLTPAAHLTCVGSTRAQIDTILRDYLALGVRHIVALRGDPPEQGVPYLPHPEGYRNAAELVAGIGRAGDFEISVAAYPETHPEARSPQTDLDNLKRKIDAGATRAITQFFFESDVYFRFLDRVQAAGIDIPIVPGILPVTNFRRVQRFAKSCGASIPHWMENLFEGLDDDPDTRKLIAAMVAGNQCRELQHRGINEFHFYTLNRASLTRSICHLLGIRADNDSPDVKHH